MVLNKEVLFIELDPEGYFWVEGKKICHIDDKKSWYNFMKGKLK